MTQGLTIRPDNSWKRHKWTSIFLLTLRNTGNTRKALEACGVSRQNVITFRSRYATFREAWEMALEDAADLLEEAARSRAVDGVPRYKFDKNGLPLRDPLEPAKPYVEYTYSDTLLIKLLEAAKPDKYRQRQSLTVNFVHESIEQLAQQLEVDPKLLLEGVYRVLSQEPAEMGLLPGSTPDPDSNEDSTAADGGQGGPSDDDNDGDPS